MSRRVARSRNALRLPRFLTVFVASIAVVIGTVVPIEAATASAAVSSSTSLARSAGDVAQTRIVKTSLTGFNPGNIISDAVFTNKSTMTEAQIQSFLNGKVSKCVVGKDEDGFPYVCLKDLKVPTQSKAADQYCAAYAGSSSEPAARILYKVATACNINPQVLIVMLQKEQGLVNHVWPSNWRYNKAMGQACPDTAPCDTAFAGFFAQVYGAARQMQIYMEGKYFQWYAPGKTWGILYHPNASCGRGNVYVANKATAALYYYTPYQPNAAALRANYGEGDGCSSYGNRNFYNYFTDWFGPTTVAVTGAIATEWQAQGGATGKYGTPLANAIYVSANGGGYVQQFQSGFIWKQASASRAYSMGSGAYLNNYRAVSAERGAWGWPTGDAVCRLADGGCRMSFQNGTAYYNPAVGSVLVPSKFDTLFASLGGENSRFGYPIKTAIAGPQAGYVQEFENGVIAYSPDTRLVEISGAVLKLWQVAGGVRSKYGYPKTAETSVAANGGGSVQEFTKGTVWSSSAGTFAMGFGPYRTNYLSAGGPAGAWGWPAGDAVCGLPGGGCTMTFQKGVGAYSPATGTVLISAAVAEEWTGYGGAARIGYPKGAVKQIAANGGGSVQEFTKGTVWSSSAGTFAMGFGPYRTNYLSAGGPAGAWGWPAGDAVCGLPGGGCTMTFQKGVGAYSVATSSRLIPNNIASAWSQRGGATGTLGYPVGEAQKSGNSLVQKFQFGVISINLTSGAVTIT